MTAETSPDRGSDDVPPALEDQADDRPISRPQGEVHRREQGVSRRTAARIAPLSPRLTDDHPIGEPWRLPSSLCPYLATESGRWRAAFPTREHRCMAVSPPVALAPDKQRRLCLVPAHETCATYLAANLVRSTALGASVGPGGQIGTAGTAPGATSGAGLVARAVGRRRVPARRPIARTTPILLERPRPGLQVSEPARRLAGQVLLVVLLVVAFAAIAIARFGAATPTGTPPASPPAVTSTAPPSASPTIRSTPSPSTSPTRSASPSTSAKPRPTPKGTPTAYQTYTVRPGDSLSSIAARFSVTSGALQRLNGLRNPSLLRVGQALRIPNG